MRLTRQSEIAIVALAACAEHFGEQITTRQIADMAGTTKDHAAQIVALMVRNRFLISHRGRRGGIELAAAPDSIALGAVIKVTQPELADLDGHPEPVADSGNSILDTILQAAFSSFVALMDRFTVADLVAVPPSRRIACLECALMNPLHRDVATTRQHTFSTHWPAQSHAPVPPEGRNPKRHIAHALRFPS